MQIVLNIVFQPNLQGWSTNDGLQQKYDTIWKLSECTNKFQFKYFYIKTHIIKINKGKDFELFVTFVNLLEVTVSIFCRLFGKCWLFILSRLAFENNMVS